ncbi:hypothetical protein C1645_819043 [Glomus cerebriforme]|uniref:F-box domain-containing protein n=1 Tax=Glomus cerebriforme TaxID=658196 RepID=A0A397TBT2_9GLOM|nr:hypothetical protein C1645_819043 [Glomus cerebriforme]
MDSKISQVQLLRTKPTLTTLPSELYDLIFANCNLIDLHFKLRYANKLFYNLVPPFILYQLRTSLLSHPSLQNYHQEVFISKNILNIKLTSKIPPFEIFPWTIKMKLCTSVDRVVSMIVKVVKHFEKINKIGTENNINSMEISLRKKWTWINC